MDQLERIRAVVDRVAASEDLEVVDVELHGRGRGTVVRIFLDKLPEPASPGAGSAQREEVPAPPAENSAPWKDEPASPAEDAAGKDLAQDIDRAQGGESADAEQGASRPSEPGTPGASLRVSPPVRPPVAPPSNALAASPSAGVSLEDCQNVSRQVGMILDVEEIIRDSYTLEVSSPGLDRKLMKPADYERFAGQRAALELRSDAPSPRRAEPGMITAGSGGVAGKFRGKLLGLRDGLVHVLLDNGETRQLAPGDIQRANLVPEFPQKVKPGKAPRQRNEQR